VLAGVLVASGTAFAQQDLGHKIPGTLGFKAGQQLDPGGYLGLGFLYYGSDQLIDRNGKPVPTRGLDVHAFASAIGFAVVFQLPGSPVYYTGSLSVPVVSLEAHAEEPAFAVSRNGLGNLAVHPVKLGWRAGPVDLVVGYGVYAPTGQFEPTALGKGQWTHELSMGGAFYCAPRRACVISALGSYELNGKKRGDIDLTRGDTMLVEGGIGIRLLRWLQVGATGYGLWQVRDHRGADVPSLLRGAHDRVYGVGPEVVLSIPSWRTQIDLRYTHDLGPRSRPVAQLFVLTLSVAAWSGS
jgi:hypothetical protein